MTDTTQAAGLTDEQIDAFIPPSPVAPKGYWLNRERAAIREAIRAALAAQAVPAIDVEKHMCGYARLGSDGVYKLVGMRRNPIMDDGDLHLILAFTDDQIEAFATPAPAEAKEEPKKCACGSTLTAHELHYYGNTCEQCEGAAMAAIEADLSTPQPHAAQPVAWMHPQMGACFSAAHWGVMASKDPVAKEFVPLYTAAPALTEEQSLRERLKRLRSFIDSIPRLEDEEVASRAAEVLSADECAALRSTHGGK